MPSHFMSIVDYYLSIFDFETALFHAQHHFDSEGTPEALSLLAKCFLADKKPFMCFLLLEEKFSLERLLENCGKDFKHGVHSLEGSLEGSLQSNDQKSFSSSPSLSTSPKRACDEARCENLHGSSDLSLDSPNLKRDSQSGFSPYADMKERKEGGENLKARSGLVGNPWEALSDSKKLLVYYYGLCCLKLDKVSQGIGHFESAKRIIGRGSPFFMFGSKEYRVLGELYLRAENPEKAGLAFMKSRKADSLCWSTIEKLCELQKTVSLSEAQYDEELLDSIFKTSVSSTIMNPNKNTKKFKFSDMPETPITPKIQKPKHRRPPEKPKNMPETSDLTEIARIVSEMARAKFYLRGFDMEKAYSAFKQLPRSLVWVKLNIALVFNEISRYELAEKKFKEALEIAPYRLDHIDVFSTTLWQLEKASDIRALVERFSGAAKEAAGYFVVLGNFYSLKKQHSKAVASFKKSQEVDWFYGYGLSQIAHEKYVVKDFSGSEKYFKKSLRLCPRDYKSLRGLSLVSEARGRMKMALEYCKRANEINRCNHVLLTGLALLESRQGNNRRALQLLERIKGNNSLADLHRAKIYLSKRQFGKAEKLVLHLLKRNESDCTLQSLLAKIYTAQRKDAKALEVLSRISSGGPLNHANKVDVDIDRLAVAAAEDLC